MAGKIPDHFIQDLLARTDLVDLIDARVPLKRSGSNFVACCPFHNEKTPSFSVNREKQFFYCFGCGARGTAIGFLMDYDRLGFVEAVETLADMAGVEVPREEGGSDARKRHELTALYDIGEKACRFYQEQLKNKLSHGRAVDYLQQRGLSGQICQRYRIGYAPPGNRSLPDNWPQAITRAAGLLGVSDSGRLFDWFRDRIVFPIRDRRGRIVGFGGRVMGEGAPKYLNSPETEIFRKHREVYGLYELLTELRKPDAILVVEGYMDVVSLAQFGINNAVATLGTATSSDHIGLLFRYTPEIVFCFDGDSAGRKAAWKALESSLPHLREGRQLRFLGLPDQHDPDSLIRDEGPEAFRERMRVAQPFSSYFFEQLSERLDLSSLEGRAALVEKAQPLIRRLPEGVFREMVLQRLQELSGQVADQSVHAPAQQMNQFRAGGAGVKPSAWRTFLALLLQNPHLVEHLDSRAVDVLCKGERGPFVRDVLVILLNQPHITVGGLLESLRGAQIEPVALKLVGWNTQIADDKVKDEFLNHLRYLTETRDREGRLAELIGKARHGELTQAEREEVRRLTTQ